MLLNIDIPDAEVVYFQVVVNESNASEKIKNANYVDVTIEEHIRKLVLDIANSYKQQQVESRLVKMKNMMQALSPVAQAELEGILYAKAVQEGIIK